MLNVAVVGLGWWGAHVAGSLKSSRKLNVIRGVELKPTAAIRKLAKEKDFKLLTDYQDVLDDPEVEGVILTIRSFVDGDDSARPRDADHASTPVA